MIHDESIKKIIFFSIPATYWMNFFPSHSFHLFTAMPNFFFPLWWLNVRTKRQAATYFGDSTNNFFSSSSHLQLPSLLKWLSVIIIFYSFFLIPHTRNLLSLLSSSSSSSCCLMLSSCFLTFLKRIMYKFFFSRSVYCA